MAFRVRMENEIEGFAVIGGPRSRVWNGIVADLWDVRCASKAGGRYVGKDPRFVFLLDMDGTDDGQFMMNRSRRDNYASSEANRISFVPADWMYMRNSAMFPSCAISICTSMRDCWGRGWCRVRSARVARSAPDVRG